MTSEHHGIPPFNREFFDPDRSFSIIGSGGIGGKAAGLAFFRDRIAPRLSTAASPGVTISLPALTVIATGVFDAFMQRNKLCDAALSGLPDSRIAHAFQQADLPTEVLGDLRALISGVRTPLAVRSSSLLEDSTDLPFAGVYATKMTPNDQLDVDARSRKLVEAIKFVYASMFFEGARGYRRAAGCRDEDEKMAVVIQEVVGARVGTRFYPTISGVARSYNHYPFGRARPEDGLVELALGLGKTIVDGDAVWSYSPAFPKAPPPFVSIPDLLKNTQTGFWAVRMGQPVEYDPTRETEYLTRSDLDEAERDGALRFLASTYDADSQRLREGLSGRGPRLLNFAPILSHASIPLNAAIRDLMKACEEAVEGPVEIELAATLDPENGVPVRLGFLQVRPLASMLDHVDLADADFDSADVLIASESSLGNGVLDGIRDLVYVATERPAPGISSEIAAEISKLNTDLLAQGRSYVLIGRGRWGTTDPSGGIPVNWGQISGAKVIVEARLPGSVAGLSQGSHFFHNLTNLRVLYLEVGNGKRDRIDWEWLSAQTPAGAARHIRLLRLDRPLRIAADGRHRRAVIRR